MDLCARRFRQPIEFDAADAEIGKNAGTPEKIPVHQISNRLIEPELARRPSMAALRIGIVTSDDGLRFVIGLQHYRRFIKGTSQQFAADVHDVGDIARPLAGQCRNRSHSPGTIGRHIPFDQAGERNRLRTDQRGGNFAEEQIAEIMAIERAEQDERPDKSR